MINITGAIKDTCFTSWCYLLLQCIKPFIETIRDKLNKEYQDNNNVFPSNKNIFRCFSTFDRNNLKVVILGQDAYHTKAKNGIPLADGLCFSVPEACNKCPPSLKTIFKELEFEYGVKRTNTDLLDWSQQGVLLLNCALTVQEGKPGSHMKVWKPFTEAIIKRIASEQEGIVYMLWGEFAKSYVQSANIDTTKNLVLMSRHPSPLAMSKGPFVGNMHFKKANEYLEANGKTGVKWV